MSIPFTEASLEHSCGRASAPSFASLLELLLLVLYVAVLHAQHRFGVSSCVGWCCRSPLILYSEYFAIIAADTWPRALSLADALSSLLLGQILCRRCRSGLRSHADALLLST